VSLGLPTIFHTVLALVVLEASLLTWDSWVRILRGTLLCGSAPLIRLPLCTVATLWGCSRRGLLNQFEGNSSRVVLGILPLTLWRRSFCHDSGIACITFATMSESENFSH
jgi:hypothetical protein